MIRRRRPLREIPFSFDSFLDVVANVVGIILRLIIVTWVGARAYAGLQPPGSPPTPPAIEEIVSLPEPQDALTPELERQRRELAEAQAKLLTELRQWEQIRQQHIILASDLADAGKRVQGLASERAALERSKTEAGKNRTALLSLTEIQARNNKLLEEIDALKKTPSAKQTLRYRTPISHPLQSEEVVFECKQGRVTLIDVGAMLDEARRNLREKGDQLRNSWEVREVTQPVGAFQLRYVVERDREVLDTVKMDAKPNATAQFHYGISGYEVVPVVADRGEAAIAALADGSAFRRVVDSLDVNQTAVTMWVYPDSFDLYRRLRDYLHDHDVTVAGRPLPKGVSIASSKHGTVSRGQ